MKPLRETMAWMRILSPLTNRNIWNKYAILSNKKTIAKHHVWKTTKLSKKLLPASTLQRPLHQQGGIIKSPMTSLNIPGNQFGGHFFSEQWERYGEKSALIDAETDRRISYNQLRSMVRRVASALHRHNYGRGDVLTIFLQNCVEFPVIYMAAASLGMTVSAVNPLFTPDELVQAITLLETKVLVVSKQTVGVAHKVINTNLKVVCTNGSDGCHDFHDFLSDDGRAFPENVDYDSCNDIASIQFSSGTTGNPKGVLLSHDNIVGNHMQFGIHEVSGMAPDDVYICTIPLFHVLGQHAIMLNSLRQGSTIVMVPKFDPVGYLNLINKYKATYLHMVPPMMIIYAKHPLMSQFDFSSVQNVFFGAAPISQHVITKLKEQMRSDANFIQGYGLSEASGGLTCGPLSSLRSDTVGVPLPNTEIKVVDINNNTILGPNKEGEICARGIQIMKGYLKNEQATAETLKDGWLHTGDIGMYDDEGYFVITDRLKELINYKGFMVAPAELEALLLTHPSVSDAAVIGLPDEMAGELPRAYVTLKSNSRTSKEDIQDYVKSKTAPHKHLRGGVEFRSEIPKSPSGKILRKILKKQLTDSLKTSN